MDERDARQTNEPGSAQTPGGRQRFAQGWLIAACLCLFVATIFWLRGHANGAFVAAVLGVLAWFFNVRSQLR